MIIPLIIIPVESGSIITESLDKLTISVEHSFQDSVVTESPVQQPENQNYLIVFYIIISSVLLIRYFVNIFRIIRKTILCKKIENTNTTLVLVEEQTQPYSFFRYIFINKSDFENCSIDKKLLIHEETHCLQYHSIDIVILELIQIFFWFNPAVWFFKKAIRLNHEYYADNAAIETDKTFAYQQLLINLVVQNNTCYLVNNFKNSLIMERLNMMTKLKPLHNAVMRKITGVSLIIIVGVSFAFCRVDKNNGTPIMNKKSSVQQDTNTEQLWKAIVSKNGINNESYMINHVPYTSHGNFAIYGKKTINKDIESFNDVVAISSIKNLYRIIKSRTATYYTKRNVLEFTDCIMNIYSLNTDTIDPMKSYRLNNFVVDFNKNEESMEEFIPTKATIQQDNATDQWWKQIVKKHKINYDSYTVHERFVIFGKKTTNDNIESFNDVVAISHYNDEFDKEFYRIYKSETASYDGKRKVLEFPDCTMNIYSLNSESIEPLHTYNHLNCGTDFSKGTSWMVGGNIIK